MKKCEFIKKVLSGKEEGENIMYIMTEKDKTDLKLITDAMVLFSKKKDDSGIQIKLSEFKKIMQKYESEEKNVSN